MQAQMAMYQAMQESARGDFSTLMAKQCWSVCYDAHLTKEELSSGLVPDETLKKAGRCQTKCIARHFEVMQLMLSARQQREKEAAMGLPPGSLNEE